MQQATILTDHGRTLTKIPPNNDAYAIKNIYQHHKFAQIENLIESDVLTRIAENTMTLARPYIIRRVNPHQVQGGTLAGGYRFGRIDWGKYDGNTHSEADKEAIRAAFKQGGLHAFATELSHLIKPFVEFVVGKKLEYDRVFLLVYKEGDFIDPHGNSQTSQRVMLQMPVSFASHTAFRMLKDGFLEPFYDNPGCLRILGAGIWHDVLPILRTEPNRTPERVLVILRFPFAA